MTDQSQPQESQPTPPPHAAGPLKTKPAKNWLLKTLLMTLLPFGLGVWGLYDALVAYPERGEKVASYRLLEYLDAAKPDFGWDGPVGVPLDESPREVLDGLRSRQGEIEAATQGTGREADRAEEQLALLNYLESLNVLFELTPERAFIENPAERFRELESEWRSSSSGPRAVPKPLASYDIPVQWLFVLIGVVAIVWGSVFMVSVMSKTFSFDPETLKLTFPSGESIVPDDVEVFDKRKWDKFLIFLRIKESHEALGGREVKVDLYRYAHLEDWIIQMHRHAFPEDFEDEGNEDAPPAEPVQAGDAESDEPSDADKPTRA